MDRILSEPVKITSREAPGLKRCAKNHWEKWAG